MFSKKVKKHRRGDGALLGFSPRSDETYAEVELLPGATQEERTRFAADAVARLAPTSDGSIDSRFIVFENRTSVSFPVADLDFSSS